ncbi:MAG: glycosyltransferase [Acetobacter sp.]|uniref:glycosyltransferase n=1 Tax=Acetobacter sp. TaxID=440 RepID=UPI0039ED097E
MKIADISEFYSPTGGGVRTYVDEKFHAAARHGHTLVVIAPGAEDRVEQRSGGRLVWVKSPLLPVDKNYRMFWHSAPVWQVLDAEQPDLVEGSSPWRGGWLAARWPGRAPRVLFMHADPVAVYPQTLLGHVLPAPTIDRLFGWFWSYLRRLNAYYDGCIVAGRWLGERFARHGLERIMVAPFGVRASAFDPTFRDETLRATMLEACGLDRSASLLVIVGRHHPEKRLGLLMRAVGKAQKSRKIGLYVIGDGLMHRQVRAQAARMEHVHVAGQVRDRQLLARMMASADALLHGSTAETFGFVVAEALCSGTPLIVPHAGGAGDLAAGAYAETYEPGNMSAAADAIARLLVRERGPMSAAARAAGVGLGDMDQHFTRLFSLYEQIIRDTRPVSTPQS